MTTVYSLSKFFILTMLLTWSCWVSAESDGVKKDPFSEVASAVVVVGYPVPQEGSMAYRDRRAAAAKRAIADVKEAYGEPLFSDGLEPTRTYFVYPNKMVVVTGAHSNNIICRLEIDTTKLRLGFSTEDTVRLAARSCREAEEDGWGAESVIRTTPIGVSTLPELSNAEVKIYASDKLYNLFSSLVRERKRIANTRISLLRGNERYSRSARDGQIVWRYAWFEDGSFLALRYREPRYNGGKASNGFACTIAINSDAAMRLDKGLFPTWCDTQEQRLQPNIDEFFDAVKTYRRNLPADSGPGVPGPYPGSHFGEFPEELTAEYWSTGEVPQ